VTRIGTFMTVIARLEPPLCGVARPVCKGPEVLAMPLRLPRKGGSGVSDFPWRFKERR